MGKNTIPELFGANVFNDRIMKERLPKDAYKAMRQTIDKGLPLSLFEHRIHRRRFVFCIFPIQRRRGLLCNGGRRGAICAATAAFPRRRKR